MRRARALLVAVTITALFAAACGSGGGVVGSGATTTVASIASPSASELSTTTTTAASTATTSAAVATTVRAVTSTPTTARRTATTATSSKISRATPLFPNLTTTTTAASGTEATNPPPPPAVGTINVFAAASLTTAFTEIGKAFEATNPDATVRFNFAASSTLVTQINQGAPADVFASADDANMKKLTDAGRNQGSPIEFATNKLQVIVGKGNPKAITSVTDMAKSSITSVTCDPAVPIGTYTQQVFQKAGITVKPKSLEPDVKGIVSKVVAGEADAGVVYATDVLAAGSGAAGVAIPDNWNVLANYPISVVQGTRDAYSAQAFMYYVAGPNGQSILAKYGFTGP